MAETTFEEDLRIRDPLEIAGITFRSRLWVGTGKYKSFEETREAIEASGADVVTVAVRRVNIVKKDEPNLLDHISPKHYKILPNTAGCYTVEEALRYARLARAAGVSDMVKLEVIGDQKTLFPDVVGLIEAARILVKEGFIVFPTRTTIRSWLGNSRMSDVPRSCPSLLRSDRDSGSGIRTTYGSSRKRSRFPSSWMPGSARLRTPRSPWRWGVPGFS